jgi:hypothetical protein
VLLDSVTFAIIKDRLEELGQVCRDGALLVVLLWSGGCKTHRGGVGGGLWECRASSSRGTAYPAGG